MEPSENLILKLNGMLEAESFDLGAFKVAFNKFKEEFRPKFKLLDFKYYNNYRRKFAKKAKIKCIEIQDFEGAAKFRELEKDCISFISLCSDYNISKSAFYYDPDYLFYFYFGTANNDKIIRKFIAPLIKNIV
jgi:hypothetical protein